MHVVGDMIALNKLPGVAQVAIQGARYSAEAISRRLAGKAPQGPFEYHDKGSMATISRFSRRRRPRQAEVHGFIAWLMWLVLHLFYIVGFKSRVTTVLHWLVSFLGRGRAERVTTQQQVYGRLALEHARPGLQGRQDRRHVDHPHRRGRHGSTVRLSDPARGTSADDCRYSAR